MARAPLDYRPIYLAFGPDAPVRSVVLAGPVFGLFGVHRRVTFGDDGGLTYLAGWQITHVTTGRSCTNTALSFNQAVAIARRWAKLPGIGELVTVADWEARGRAYLPDLKAIHNQHVAIGRAARRKQR